MHPPDCALTGDANTVGVRPIAGTLRRMVRTLETAVVLNTMMELLEQTPRCSGPLQAWAVISAAVTAATTDAPGLVAPWTLGAPTLVGSYWSQAPCGTWRARLVSHILYINPNGAYCIVDAKGGGWPVLERSASCGARFEMPGAAVRVDAWV